MGELTALHQTPSWIQREGEREKGRKGQGGTGKGEMKKRGKKRAKGRERAGKERRGKKAGRGKGRRGHPLPAISGSATARETFPSWGLSGGE